MNRYLLSTGRSTYSVEYYIMDLIKLYLQIYPGDIPGASGIGFDFTIRNTTTSELPEKVKTMVENLIGVVQKDFGGGIGITVDEVVIVGESSARITITVNRSLSEDITINLYNE